MAELGKFEQSARSHMDENTGMSYQRLSLKTLRKMCTTCSLTELRVFATGDFILRGQFLENKPIFMCTVCKTLFLAMHVILLPTSSHFALPLAAAQHLL